MTSEQLAQAAYEAHALSLIQAQRGSGTAYPYENLQAREKTAWRASVKAVLDVVASTFDDFTKRNGPQS